MSNATWVRQAVRGTVITTEAGERATVADLSDVGAIVQPEQGGEARRITMREIRATIALWTRLRLPPSPAQLHEAGIAEANADYLVLLIAAIRRAPGIKEWVHADRFERRATDGVALVQDQATSCGSERWSS